MESYALAADIGGSHITCRLFSLKTMQPLSFPHVRVAIDSRASADSILEGWCNALNQAASSLSWTQLSGVGIAMPGPFDYENGIAWFEGVEKFEALYGIDVRTALIQRLELPADFTIRFINDATAFAIGEAMAGHGAGRKKIIALTLGSGFGATFLSGSLPVTRHPDLPDNGYLYNLPFREGIADAYFSTRWFLNRYSELTGKKVAHVKELIDTDLPVTDRLMGEFGANLGEFMAPWIKVFGAECLVIGGNIAQEMPRFKPAFTGALAERGVSADCFQASEGEASALLGSAALCRDDFYNRINA